MDGGGDVHPVTPSKTAAAKTFIKYMESVGSTNVYDSLSKVFLAFMYCAVGQNYQESRRKNWATSLSVYSFARTAHSFACSALPFLLALLARFDALTRSLACSLHSLPRWWDNE